MEWRHLPIAGFLLTSSAVAGWGLVEQRATTPHSTSIKVVQGLLMVIGTLAAVIGGFALLFWVMVLVPVL